MFAKALLILPLPVVIVIAVPPRASLGGVNLPLVRFHRAPFSKRTPSKISKYVCPKLECITIPAA